MRKRLLAIGNYGRWFFIVCYGICLVWSLFSGHSEAFGAQLAPFVFLSLSLPQFMYDLCGVKPLADREDFVHSTPMIALKPIQSDQWRDPGSSRSLH